MQHVSALCLFELSRSVSKAYIEITPAKCIQFIHSYVEMHRRGLINVQCKSQTDFNITLRPWAMLMICRRLIIDKHIFTWTCTIHFFFICHIQDFFYLSVFYICFVMLNIDSTHVLMICIHIVIW